MSLHGEIMNLQCQVPADVGINQAHAWKNGHKQARHAAAELVTAADSELDRLRELERRVAKRCAEAVQSWAPELRELLTHNAELCGGPSGPSERAPG